MSQRAVLRGFLLCILPVLTALPASASITFTPNNVSIGLGQSSQTITAQIVYTATAGLPGGLQTLGLNPQYFLPPGVTTVPSSITYSVVAGQQTATVSFRIAVSLDAWSGNWELPFVNTPNPAGQGLLNIEILPFTIAPGTVTVQAGTTSGALTATIGGFVESYPNGPQELVFSGLPSGATPVPSPVSWVMPPQQNWGTVTFRIAANASTAAGAYVVNVQNSPFQVGSASFNLVVRPGVQPSGSLAAKVGNSAMEVCAGGDAVENSITVTPLEGYRGSPTVTFSGVPAGVQITPSPIPVPALPPAATVTFSVSALPGAAPGIHEITAVAKDPIAAATVTFTVEVLPTDFTPSVAPASLSLGSGGTPATLTASVSAGSCSLPSSITVAPSGLPEGVTVAPQSAVLSAPDYAPVSFVFTAAGAAPTGGGTVSLTFTPSTGAAKTAPVPVSVRHVGSLAAAAGQARIDLCPAGPSQQNTVTVTPVDGYEGSPVITFPGLPAGLTVSQASIPVLPIPPARVVAFGISVDAGAPPGERTVSVQVTDPLGPTATATFVVNVLPPDFTPAITPASVALNGGGAPASVTAAITPGSCAPTTSITVAPTGLPPGITVTPPSAVLQAPGFDPVAFSIQASSGAAPGAASIAFTFTPQGSPATTANAGIVVCGPPPAPVGPRVTPQGNPQGPVTATDFLALSWAPAASPFPQTRFEWRINGEPWSSTAATTAGAPPRGKIDPVQLFVRGFSCAPELGPGAEAASPVYSLGPPVADFAVPPTVTVGSPTTFTDTSSPQATSWLWFPGDGMPAVTVQSPTVTFTSAGPKTVVLLATNGSGSSSKTKTVNVFPPVSRPTARASVTRSFDRQPDGRLALARVEVEAGTALHLRRLEGDGDSVAFLRLVDADGQVVVERRLVLAAGEEARHDLSAWAVGEFRIELIGPEGLEAAIEESAIPPGGPEMPVTPRQPESGSSR